MFLDLCISSSNEYILVTIKIFLDVDLCERDVQFYIYQDMVHG